MAIVYGFLWLGIAALAVHFGQDYVVSNWARGAVFYEEGLIVGSVFIFLIVFFWNMYSGETVFFLLIALLVYGYWTTGKDPIYLASVQEHIDTGEFEKRDYRKNPYTEGIYSRKDLHHRVNTLIALREEMKKQGQKVDVMKRAKLHDQTFVLGPGESTPEIEFFSLDRWDPQKTARVYFVTYVIRVEGDGIGVEYPKFFLWSWVSGSKNVLSFYEKRTNLKKPFLFGPADNVYKKIRAVERKKRMGGGECTRVFFNPGHSQVKVTVEWWYNPRW